MPGSPSWGVHPGESIPDFHKGCPGVHPGESIPVFQPQARNTQRPSHCLGVPAAQNPVFAFPTGLEFGGSQGLWVPWAGRIPGWVLSLVVPNRAGRNEEKWGEDKREIYSSATDGAEGRNGNLTSMDGQGHRRGTPAQALFSQPFPGAERNSGIS